MNKMSRKGIAVLSAVLALLCALPAFAQQDTHPPALTGFSFTSTQVDTTSTSAAVNVTAQFTDDLSGVYYGTMVFLSPSRQHSANVFLSLSAGTNLNGTYSGTATIPAYSEPGTWTVYYLSVQD